MKLIRLSGSNANFEVNFFEDIFVPKNSKLCLKNLSFTRIFEVLKINAINNTFFITADGEEDVEITFDTKTYNQLDYTEFFREMVRKLNNNIEMTNNGSFVGLQFRYNFDEDLNFFKLNATKSPLFFSKNFLNIDQSSAHITMNRQLRITKTSEAGVGNGGDVDTEIPDRVYFDEDIRFTRGAGLFTCKIGLLADNGANNHTGFFMGLSDAPNISGEIVYNIEIRRTTDAYTAIRDGANVAGIVLQPQSYNNTLNENDILEIRRDNGAIIGSVRQQAGTTLLFSHQLDAQDDREFYPVFGIYGRSDRTRISIPRINLDPYKTSRQLGTESSMYSDANIATVFNSVQRPPEKALTLTAHQDVNTFLNIQTPITITDNFLWEFDSSGLLNINLNDDNYVVEMLNIDLDSFEGTRGRRMNILATIPANNSSDGVLNYEPNERLCVDINNRFDLTLRNIRCRVLDKNLEPIKTDGNSILTLLIENKNE